MHSALVAYITAFAVLSGLAEAAAVPHRRLFGIFDPPKPSTPVPNPPEVGTKVGGWTSIGCYTDTILRVFTGAAVTSNQVSQDMCVGFCDSRNFWYAAVEGGNSCYCSNFPPLVPAALGSCKQYACAANSAQSCGGDWNMIAFFNTAGSDAASTSSSLSQSAAAFSSSSISASISASSAASLSRSASISASSAASISSSLSASAAASSSLSLSASASRSSSLSVSAASSSLSASASLSSSLSQSAAAFSASSTSASLSASAAASSSASLSRSASLSSSLSQSASQSSSLSASAAAASTSSSLSASASLSSSLSASVAQASTSASLSASASLSSSLSVSAAQASTSASLSSSASLSRSASASAFSASSISSSLSASASAYSSSSLSASAAAYTSSSLSASASQSSSLSASAAQWSASVSSSASVASASASASASAASASQSASVAAASQSASISASVSRSAASASASQSASAASASASQSASIAAASQSASISASASRSAAAASASQSASVASASASQSASIASASASQAAAFSSAQASSAAAASSSASQAAASSLSASISASSASASQAAAYSSAQASYAAAQSSSAASAAAASASASQAAAQSLSASISASSASASQAAAYSSAQASYAAAQSSSAASAAAASASASQAAAQSASASSAAASQSAAYASAQASYAAAQSSSSAAAAAQASQDAAQSALLQSAAAASSSSLASSLAAYSSSLAAQTTSTISSVAATATPTSNAASLPSPWVPAGSGGSMIVIAEGTNGRALTGASTSSSDMTYSKCLSYCAGQGFMLAGLEYSTECYCGNALSNSAALSKTSPNGFMKCGGDQNSICGGPDAITLFVTPQALSSLNADLTAPLGGAANTATATLSSAAAGPTGATGTIPSPWQSMGAIAEGTSGRALTGGSMSAPDLTYEKCLNWCAQQGFTLCGMEYSSECYGSSTGLTNGAALSRGSSNQDMMCSGNKQQVCGGPDKITLFAVPSAISSLNADLNGPAAGAAGAGSGNGQGASGATSTASSAAGQPTGGAGASLPAGWSSAGAIAEGINGRALTGASTSASDMTYAKCINFCSGKGFSIAGVEYSSECYCDNQLRNAAALSRTSQRNNMPCSGDSQSICGGPDTLTLFVSSAATSALNADLNAPVNGGANGASTSTANAAPAQSSAAASGPQAPTLSSGWAIASTSCIAEGTSGRALNADRTYADNMTPKMCMDYCGSKGYAYSGVEYGSECYCDNSLTNGASLSLPSNNCNMKCSGSSEICGGSSALSLFYNAGNAANAANAQSSSAPAAQSTSSAAASAPTGQSGSGSGQGQQGTSTSSAAASGPTKKTDGLPTGWQSAGGGCIQEVANRALDGAAYSSSAMTVNSCLSFCQARGYAFAGIEYGQECYCSASLANGASLDNTSGQCYMECPGEKGTTCGGPNAIQIYQNPNATPAPVQSADGLLGCIKDVPGRALPSLYQSSPDMTNDKCRSICKAGGFKYFGTEYGSECGCGNELSNGASFSSVSQMCTMPCAGDSTQTCGGPASLSVYTV